MTGETNDRGYSFDLGWDDDQVYDEILSLISEFKIDETKKVEIPITGKIIFDFGKKELTAEVEAE